jgi:transposase
MATSIRLEPHLTTGELKKRYHNCRKAQEKVRLQALYLISKGVVAAEAARRVGRASSWMTNVVRRYNEGGAAAVERKKSAKVSHRASLDEKLALELSAALSDKAPDGGIWTSGKVARWIAARTGKKVHSCTGWRTLKRLGFSLQVPRPRNRRQACLEEQTAFKKN